MSHTQHDLVHLHDHLSNFYDFVHMSHCVKDVPAMAQAIEYVLTGIESVSRTLPRDAVTVPVREEGHKSPTDKELQVAIIQSTQALARVTPDGAAFCIVFIDKRKPTRVAFGTSWDIEPTVDALTKFLKSQKLA